MEDKTFNTVRWLRVVLERIVMWSIMKAERSRERFLTGLNELDGRLMKTGDRCFHIGIGGGCGLRCAAFCDGECQEPYEFKIEELLEEFNSEEMEEISEYYPKFTA